MNEVKFVVEKEKALLFSLDYKDWEGDVRGWQDAYFQVLSWKNTWGLAIDVDILAHMDHSAYVRIITKYESESMKSNMIEWLEGLGYKNVKAQEIKVALIDGYIDEDEYDGYDDVYDTFIG